jgi:hypothetical protein
MMPNRKQILEKAQEMYVNDRAKMGDPVFDTTPTAQELTENGYTSLAVSELLRDQTKVSDQWKNYAEQNEDLEFETENFIDVETILRSGFAIFGNSGSGKTNLCKLIADRLIKSGITVYVLDSAQQWLHMPGFKEIVVSGRGRYDWNVENTIFNLSSLSIPDRISFVDVFCGALVEPRFRNRWEVVIFEECQLYIPNNALRSLKKYGNVLSFLTLGRNFHLRYGLISQFPSYVEKYLIRNTQLRYYGWMHETNDIRYVSSMISREAVQKLKTLEAGEFLYENMGRIKLLKTSMYENGQLLAPHNCALNTNKVGNLHP